MDTFPIIIAIKFQFTTSHLLHGRPQIKGYLPSTLLKNPLTGTNLSMCFRWGNSVLENSINLTIIAQLVNFGALDPSPCLKQSLPLDLWMGGGSVYPWEEQWEKRFRGSARLYRTFKPKLGVGIYSVSNGKTLKGFKQESSISQYCILYRCWLHQWCRKWMEGNKRGIRKNN